MIPSIGSDGSMAFVVPSLYMSAWLDEYILQVLLERPTNLISSHGTISRKPLVRVALLQYARLVLTTGTYAAICYYRRNGP